MLVNIQPRDSPHVVWESLSGPFSRDQIKLTLIDFFDWNLRSWRDFRYFKVKILEFQARPEVVGREGLVEVADVDVLWDVDQRERQTTSGSPAYGISLPQRSDLPALYNP